MNTALILGGVLYLLTRSNPSISQGQKQQSYSPFYLVGTGIQNPVAHTRVNGVPLTSTMASDYQYSLVGDNRGVHLSGGTANVGTFKARKIT